MFKKEYYLKQKNISFATILYANRTNASVANALFVKQAGIKLCNNNKLLTSHYVTYNTTMVNHIYIYIYRC